MVPEGLTFEGRPQLVARMRGKAAVARCCSRAIDVVDVEPRAD
jgi:hypothetical protein